MFMPQRISIARATNAPSNLDAFRHPVWLVELPEPATRSAVSARK
jgi:hypothetical protein